MRKKIMLMQFKYNVASRGREQANNTWMIYRNIDKGTDDVIYTTHIELKVDVITDEKKYNGFGMLCRGEIELRNYPNDPSRQFAVIVPEK
jgi:hypothetical protein